jgi:hypothetical protein
MKALKLSTLAAFLLVLSACTKDVDTLSTSSTSLSASTSAPSEEQTIGANKVAGQTVQLQTLSVSPAINYSITPNEVVEGGSTTLTGEITFQQEVKQFNYSIQYAAMQTNGEWGTWIDTDLGDQIKIGKDEPGSKSFPISVPIDTDELGLTPGVYGWKIHIAGGDLKNEQMFSEIKTLKVIKACDPLAVVASLGTPENLGGNKYRFTVTYTVTSCPAVGSAKLQGGLTAFSTMVNSYDGQDQKGVERKETNNSNFIYYWNFNVTAGYQNTFTMVFEKEIKEAGPQEITGTWSVSYKNPTTGLEEKALAQPVVFTK